MTRLIVLLMLTSVAGCGQSDVDHAMSEHEKGVGQFEGGIFDMVLSGIENTNERLCFLNTELNDHSFSDCLVSVV
jgi:hypothetical protein